MGKFVDISGRKYGRLLVIGIAGERNVNGAHVWNTICDCGKFHKVVGTMLRNGDSKSCGCASRERMDAWVKSHIGKPSCNSKSDKHVSVSRILRYYKDNAVKRGYEFLLSRDEFIKLISGNCFYCNIEPNQSYKFAKSSGSYLYNGIDRVNNDIGYVIDNCVSCCSKCNRAKYNMNLNDFLKLIENIYKNIIMVNK